MSNKPLSNLEIIDASKSYHCMELEELFWEILFLKKTKFNVCGILNLDSSCGDGKNLGGVVPER